jgi:tRNA-modifying protein YgfZ
MPRILLQDRGVVRIGGPDAEKLLQDVLTPDLSNLSDASPGALLTPQGKIMFDFLISRNGADFLIDLDGAVMNDFIRRMTLYKLRAKAEIAADDATTVVALWGETPPAGAVRDLRFRNGIEVWRLYGAPDDANRDRGPYDRLRVAEGVAECGRDFAASDAFPHDVLMDLNGGVSFRKGCFVGQEVVSRMQHRGTARRRIAIVEGASDLPASGTAITFGGKSAGALGSVAGKNALAIVRTDRVGSALSRGEAASAGQVAVTLALPEWTGLAFSGGSEDE